MKPSIDCSHWRSVRRPGIGHCQNPESTVRLPTYEHCLRHCTLYDGKLLGDQIEKFFAAIGAKQVARVVSAVRRRPCRCRERRDKINQLHREGKLRRIGSPVDGGTL